jgi:hypothetical protein
VKRNLNSQTFCVIEGKLISDPTNEEVSSSNYYFSIIKFLESEEFLIHKISGDVLNVQLLKQAIKRFN